MHIIGGSSIALCIDTIVMGISSKLIKYFIIIYHYFYIDNNIFLFPELPKSIICFQ